MAACRVEFGSPSNARFDQRLSDCRLQIADCRLQIAVGSWQLAVGIRTGRQTDLVFRHNLVSGLKGFNPVAAGYGSNERVFV